MIDQNGLMVLHKRYLAEDMLGNATETPEGLFRRVSSAMTRPELNYGDGRAEQMAEVFYQMMSNLEFLPNSPTLMNTGRELGQLAVCFVLPIEDSLDSIFEQVKNTAKIHQSGGGTGFSFSHLRPRDDVVASTMGVASGPVSFIRIFNTATEVVKQGGTRRGANMGILRIDRPDIEEFITVKKDSRELANFNLSVAITDEFMAAFTRDGDFNLTNPRTKNVVKSVRGRKLFLLIAESAWASGEPGVIIIDTINRSNPTPTSERLKRRTRAGNSLCSPTNPAALAPSTWGRS
jgi:ribonucleoside-diphosphate reductase alpha chain